MSLGLPATGLAQTALEAIGYDRLVAEVGGTLEDGSGAVVGLVEAANSGSYFPDVSHPELSGKSFVDNTGTNVGTSTHATSVALRQVGTGSSPSPGVADIAVFEANDWIGSILGFGTSNPPLTQTHASMNHSYIGNDLSEAYATELNRRLDFLAARDDVTMAVGANNGSSNPIPQLWLHSYNTISVGVSDGDHSHGTTSFNGAGRMKPEIVAPGTATSYATPLVASAASLLHRMAVGSGNAFASRIEVLKAVLLAGATRSEFPSWANSSTQPLDSTYGAGELNVYNSYHIMEAGETDGSATEPSGSMSLRGWDSAPSPTTGDALYYTVDLMAPENEVSVNLAWNAEVSDSGGNLDYDELVLANLDLELYDSSGGFPGSLIAASASTVDNVELLSLEDLAAGRYTVAVKTISGMADYGLAWQFIERSALIFADGFEDGTSSAWSPYPANKRDELPQSTPSITPRPGGERPE